MGKERSEKQPPLNPNITEPPYWLPLLERTADHLTQGSLNEYELQVLLVLDGLGTTREVADWLDFAKDCPLHPQDPLTGKINGGAITSIRFIDVSSEGIIRGLSPAGEVFLSQYQSS